MVDTIVVVPVVVVVCCEVTEDVGDVGEELEVGVGFRFVVAVVVVVVDSLPPL